MKIIILFLVLSCLIIPETRGQSRDFYEISRLPFTSDQFDEFAPSYYRQGIVFTTNRRTDFLISRMTDDGETLFNIFHTSLNQSGRWATPDLLDKNLRSKYHDGPASFSRDGTRIYFTRNLAVRGSGSSTLGIFTATYSNGQWINITPFPYNSNNYNLAHPSISDDGRALYFASDMPGGYGGMDIYMSALSGQSWSSPVNLGPGVNSAKDEVFPYIHPGGRLYFSSNNETNGSLDLFYSLQEDNNRQPRVRLTGPFNSEADDFGFIADNDLKAGYFTSRREGTDNIYSFLSTFPSFSGCNTLSEPELCYVFFEQTARNIDTTTLYLEWDMGDGTRYRGMEADHCFEDTGTYTVRLDVIDLITGEMQSNVAYYNFTIERIEQPYISAPDTVYTNRQFMLDASETFLRNFDIDDYYWELGDGNKSAGEKIYHTYSEPGTYRVILGILSDPDSPFGLQKPCVFREVVVLDETDGSTSP